MIYVFALYPQRHRVSFTTAAIRTQLIALRQAPCRFFLKTIRFDGCLRFFITHKPKKIALKTNDLALNAKAVFEIDFRDQDTTKKEYPCFLTRVF
jgi:hypothetical protein